MVKTYSRLGRVAGRTLLVAAMTGLLVGCGGGSSSDEVTLGEQDFDNDGIANSEDTDADGDNILDVDDNFVDLDGDGLDDITLLTEEEANGTQVVEVSEENPCGGEAGLDNSSVNDNWNDNCVVKRSSIGGQFADSLFSVGIQRVLFCEGFGGSGNDYRTFADGEYGPASETAAKAFQSAESLTDDGIIGPQTWAALQGRIELLANGEVGVSPDTWGFATGVCAGIPMFYQAFSVADNGLDIVLGGWTLARNQPNQAEEVAFSYEEPFGRL